MISYSLPGTRQYQQRIFPNPALLKPETRLRTYEDVIAHFTETSLAQDGIEIVQGSLTVDGSSSGSGYAVSFDPKPQFAQQGQQFAAMHVAMLDANHAGLALAGADACRRTPAWNPMAGFPVNSSDGPSEWLPCLPLGMPIVNHRAVILMHYPPIIAYRTADYLNNNTLHRWAQVLKCAGVDQPTRYHAIMDVNPIAAPGSGESEYANDYFPINLTSLFFDNEESGLGYLSSMLDLMLNPPSNDKNRQTLPLLVCGSPLYDPQAPGWFRARFKDQLPKDKNGTPTVAMLQTGSINIYPESPKQTPYLIANHMIAAGVTGRCTSDATNVPNILKYEAQDLVAATFLGLYAEDTSITPPEAVRRACARWFGALDGNGAPNPPNDEDRLAICALAQMDLCFDQIKRGPKYSYDQAKARCREKGGKTFCPCFGCD